ncbi:uncharacterized protein LOC112345446 isoform X2 [Selaginella moellendorffii]|uniref:uncharacterized protein LOC112345446 isoform X2 n=1 Tax=Selaginella moellendorffii TaxID=88036 RepID=UPI000D1C2E28|nr:uncharacterized protein LOC112345446 isoform X2 [Selaginella moellendorffii]|eukprot:XP_024527973.1 uncharacterized protein LOC112345446 isoform X2 [Selaginella moellendorffii]
MQIERSENLKVAKPKDFFVKFKDEEGGGGASGGDFKPLASPTTPFQFEARQDHLDRLQHQRQQQQQRQRHFFEDPTLFDEDAARRIQNTLQLQLLSYVRLHGVQQQQNSRYSQQGAPIPEYFQEQRHEHHPTIALLQQRFQRLERDKEMRQTKQLYNSNHEVIIQPRPSFTSPCSTFPPPPSSSSSMSTSCNPHHNLMRNTTTSSSMVFPVHPDTPAPFFGTINPEKDPVDHPHGAKSSKTVLLSLLDNPAQDEFSDQSELPASNSSASLLPRDLVQQPYRPGLLKNWKTAKRSIPIDDDEEVDTSLHL